MTTSQLVNVKTSPSAPQQNHETSPLIRQETTIMYYKRKTDNPNTKKMYEVFLSDFSIFLVKLPSSKMKTWAQIAYDREVVLLGHQLNGMQIGLVSKVWIQSNKLLGIIVDNTSIGLDPKPSHDEFKVDRIDKAVATAYHGLIRAAINLSFNSVKKDKKLAIAITSYIRKVYLRSLQLPSLDSITMATFDYVIAYSVSRFIMLQTHLIAADFAESYVDTEHSEDATAALDIIKSVDVAFKQIDNMREIGRLFRLLNISTDNDMKHISQMTSKLGTLGYINITGPVDYALASIIISLYVKDYSQLLIDKVSQVGIEHLVEYYLKQIKFGSA